MILGTDKSILSAIAVYFVGKRSIGVVVIFFVRCNKYINFRMRNPKEIKEIFLIIC
jgi:hypothetical protein